MKPTLNALPGLTYALLAVFFVVTLLRGQSDTTLMVIVGAIVMFACCWTSAIHLLGARAALRFVLVGVVFGWLAEELGATRGWFFGSYAYTAVLGPRLGAVPVIIPLMWFALAYIAYVIANLMVWQSPSDGAAPLFQSVTMSLLAAMIVTAYDLGADPYMVFTLKAWIMTMKDGWWFGETLEGFFGWAFVAFAIIFTFRLGLRASAPVPALPVARRHALVPLAIYAGNMVFQICLGSPVETRTIALFAMGIPLLTALCGFQRWSGSAAPAAVRA